MTFNEAAVFKWVVIVVLAAALVTAVTLLTSQLVGAIFFALVLLAGCVHSVRWWRDRVQRRDQSEGEGAAEQLHQDEGRD